MMNIWLLLHVIGVVMAVGNMVTAAVWKTLADKTRQLTVIYYAAKTVMLMDYVFTLPGILLIIKYYNLLFTGIQKYRRSQSTAVGRSYIFSHIIIRI